jgi:hypothetical protein
MKQKNYRKSLKRKKFLQKVSKLLVAFSIVSVTLTTVFFSKNVDCITRAYAEPHDTAYGLCLDTSHLKNVDVITTKTINDSILFYTDSILNIKELLVNEIEKYMAQNSRRPKLSAEYIVSVCEDKGFDICLLLSQAQQESSFGYRMRGNSCFGVISKKYKNTDRAIDDYVRIMQKHYIIDRTPEELISSNFRMEKNKKAKYAGDSAYGKRIEQIRNGIIKKTNIHKLYTDLIFMNSQLALLKDKNNTMQFLAMTENNIE